jgi:hypothetical protein
LALQAVADYGEPAAHPTRALAARLFHRATNALLERSMCRPAPRVFFAFPLALSSALAAAQTNLPPGFHERELAQTIRRAGHDCGAVESIDIAPNPEGGLDSFRPEVALCTNGKRFLVVKGGRGGPNARPVVRPLPAENRI